MATLVQQSTGISEFRVPFAGPLPGSVFKGPGEWVLAVRDGKPEAVTLRFFPSALAFQAKLPGMAEACPFPVSAFDLGAAVAAGGRPVVDFAGGAAVLARVPAGIADLEGLERFLATGPLVFDAGDYGLAAIAVESD